jgi:nitroimidazol reductase NimA-like FMN-containing flavoprotein (pyridoxamine 5'-phosphate oxidase superfamily)
MLVTTQTVMDLGTAPTDAAPPSTETSLRTRIRRHPERAAPERAEEILRAGRIAHVGFAVDGQPFVLPFGYYYEDGMLYLHGAPASRTIKTLRAGMPVCAEVTLLDGLVASRNAQSHSMNYRSVMVFGHAEPVRGLDEKRAIFERMTAAFFPNRTAGRDYYAARERDLRAVELMAIRVEELSAKAREGGPRGDRDAAEAQDETATVTGYVVELPGIDA